MAIVSPAFMGNAKLVKNEPSYILMDIFKQNVDGTAWFLLVANSQNVRGEKQEENLVKDYSIQMQWA